MFELAAFERERDQRLCPPVVIDAAGFRSFFEPSRLFLVAEIRVCEYAHEKREPIVQTPGRVACLCLLGAGRQLTDSLPVAGKLLDLEQHGDGVQAMVRRQPGRDLVVELRNPPCVVETALPKIRRQRRPQGIRAMIRIADPRKETGPSGWSPVAVAGTAASCAMLALLVGSLLVLRRRRGAAA